MGARVSEGLERANLALPAPPALDVTRHALFLDLDGTLVEIEARPDLVKSDDGLLRALKHISKGLGGACAIVTGRTIEDADSILGGAVDCISGLHGQDMRVRGERTSRVQNESLRSAARHVDQLVASGALFARVEDKGGALALHYRETPEHARLIQAAAEELAEVHDLKVMHGKMVAELLPKGVSKLDAVSALMQREPFIGRTPVAVGDDITDEDAFQAAWARGGFGVLVGPQRETYAAYRLHNVAAVRAWLERAS